MARRRTTRGKVCEKLWWPEGDDSDLVATCALRFDGEAYDSSLGQKGGAGTYEMLKRLYDTHFATSFDLHPDLEHNLAIFFWLQRSLKWLDRLPDRESVLYVWLFLNLYRAEVPERYRLGDYWTKWEEGDYKLRALQFSARVRPAVEIEVRKWAS